MSDVTRRDALAITALAAMATTTFDIAHADEPSKDPTLLIPPTDTTASSSIPIQVKIKKSKFGPANPTKVQIDLAIVDGSSNQNDAYASKNFIFSSTLQGMALPPKDANPDTAIVLMTRLKVPSGDQDKNADKDKSKNQQQKGATKTNILIATVTYFYTTPAPDNKSTLNVSNVIQAMQTITFKNEDCALSDTALLRLSLQPAAVEKSGDLVMLRAVVPPVPPVLATSTGAGSNPRQLKTIRGAASDPPTPTSEYFNMDIKNIKDATLSDEAFVGFSLFPTASDSGQVVMYWDYQGDISAGLMASSLFVPPPKPKS